MQRSVRSTAGSIALMLVLSAPGSLRAEAPKTPAQTLDPGAVVTAYLTALKAGNFAAAYSYISKGMAQHKDRDAWAKEQQWTMQMSDAKIFDFHVYPGKVEGDRAQVPNILSSQDKFLNQLGVQEHELYTLIREDGQWKIDQQQLLEKSEQRKWFPSQTQER
jgi:hypothetical protein